MSTRMHFCPGIAADRLAELAAESNKPKAVVLRTLIESAPESDDAVFCEAYEFFTVMGRKMKEASLAGKYEHVVEIALSVQEKGSELPEIAIGATGKIDLLSEVKAAQGSSMSFRPMDQREKLERLSARVGLSMSVVLRCLVLEVDMPSSIEGRVYARLSQLGGFMKHIASSLPDGKWQRLAKCGVSTCGLALRKYKSFDLRQVDSQILDIGQN